MSGFVEHIRMGKSPPDVVHRSPWSGTEPSREEFLRIAEIALGSYYKNDGQIPLEAKDEFGANRGRPPVVEAVRFVGDDGAELDGFRYDLHDLMRDNTKAHNA
jgi:hypothetical protein